MAKPLIGASQNAIDDLLRSAGTDVPETYLQMLRLFNGRGDELLSAERAVEINLLYDHVQELMPGERVC